LGSVPTFSTIGSCPSTDFSKGFKVFDSAVSSFGFVSAAAGVSSVSRAGVEAEPSDAILTRVVVTSAGRDLVDALAFLVNWIDGWRFCLGESRRDVEQFTTLEATFCATDMLSRATSVTGAALDVREIADHDPGYQLYRGRNKLLAI
jgi:hypothetical protein